MIPFPQSEPLLFLIKEGATWSQIKSAELEK